MQYTFYRTTNLLNGWKYFGVHATEDPNDDYLGSGLVLNNAINVHGRENFKRRSA